MFRTPLGAALLAVEVLYRDDFESDALIPAVLASVIAYSVVISIFGESTLFAHPSRFPFILGHLWLYGLLALLVAVVANAVPGHAARGAVGVDSGSTVPEWAKPGLGGLALGLFCVPIILFVGWRVHQPGQGLGLFGGGYGAVQIAISGAPWLPVGWAGAGLLLLLCLAKICRVVADHRHRRQRGRLRAVAGDRRPLRRRLRARGAAAVGRPAHRPGRVRAGRHGHVLRRHRAHAAVARWCWCASSPAATTCSCR